MHECRVRHLTQFATQVPAALPGRVRLPPGYTASCAPPGRLDLASPVWERADGILHAGVRWPNPEGCGGSLVALRGIEEDSAAAAKAEPTDRIDRDSWREALSVWAWSGGC